jgi:hypothetical protein
MRIGPKIVALGVLLAGTGLIADPAGGAVPVDVNARAGVLTEPYCSVDGSK